MLHAGQIAVLSVRSEGKNRGIRVQCGIQHGFRDHGRSENIGIGHLGAQQIDHAAVLRRRGMHHDGGIACFLKFIADSAHEKTAQRIAQIPFDAAEYHSDLIGFFHRKGTAGDARTVIAPVAYGHDPFPGRFLHLPGKTAVQRP